MTRIFTLGAVGLIIATIAFIILGVASQAPGLMILSLLCTFPLFMLVLGLAVGRASNEFQVVRKERASKALQRIHMQKEPLS